MKPSPLHERHIHGQGTGEHDWQHWDGWRRGRRCIAAGLLSGHPRLVVVAPHPDDEVLAAGGLIAAAAQSGAAVLVVGVTDGGASHPGSALWRKDDLVAVRRSERAAALDVLGGPGVEVVEVGLPDGTATAHEPVLRDALASELRADDLVISPWRLDGHPDHETTARAAAAAATPVGARHLEAPIWGWHWAAPDELPADRVLLHELPPGLLQLKAAAIECFGSQRSPDPTTGAGPILTDLMVARFRRPLEVFFT